MRSFLRIFVGLFVCVGSGTAHAITITKAASVAPQETSTSTATASLIPTVLNLVSGVQQLNAQQRALTAECVPTQQEINFVDNTMKEWAKTGASTATEIQRRLDRQRCATAVGGYNAAVQIAAGTDGGEICYDYFAGDGNVGMVWAGFPKVGIASYCEDGSLSCSNKKTVSDIYELFNLITFTEADYTESELKMASQLITKIEKCSDAKLSAKKREMWGAFLTDTISNLGQPTNTDTIMQQVSSITSGGGALGSLGSLGSFASQILGN